MSVSYANFWLARPKLFVNCKREWNLFLYFNVEERLRRSQEASMVVHLAGGGQAKAILKSQAPTLWIFFEVKIGHHISLHEVWQSPYRFSVYLDLVSNCGIQIISINTIKIYAIIYKKKTSFSFSFLIKTDLDITSDIYFVII